MLSWKKGRPIARVVGGKKGKSLIRLLTDDDKDAKKDAVGLGDVFDLIDDDVFSIKGLGKRLRIKEVLRLRKCLIKNKKPKNKDLLPTFKKIMAKVDEKKQKEVVIHSGEIHQVPNPDTRDCIYISGASGAGKSVYTGKYLAQYKKMFPKNPIFIFSRVEEDEALDYLHPTRILIDQDFVDDPIKLEELKNSCCVFDDIDTIIDKKRKEAVQGLRNCVLEMGRHHGIYCVSTSHQMMNYRESKILLSESTNTVFFPRSGAVYHIKRFLKEYCGLEKDQIARILKLPSRWVSISKTYPQFVMYDKGIYIV